MKKGCNKISLNNISIYLLVQMNYLRHLGDLYILILNVLFLVIPLLALRDFLQQHQIAFQTQQDEPEDHIGLMLMLAAYLAENRPHLLIKFLREHFLTWAYHFLEQLSKIENSDFYQALALLTIKTLQQWQVDLHINVPTVRFYR